MRSHETGGSARRKPRSQRASIAVACSLLTIAGLITDRTRADEPAPAVLHAQPPELPERAQDEWFNSPPLKLSALRGRVVVLHFWTFGCINCKHNDAAYKPRFRSTQPKG